MGTKLVAIAGSQGSGKSTLIDALQQCNDLHIGVVSRKTSRSVLQEWNTDLTTVNENVELSQRFQDEIIKRKIEDDLEMLNSDFDIVLTERTPVDFFVYALINMGKHNHCDEWVNDYYQTCVDACSVYDSVVHLPTGAFTVVNDGVRSANKHYSRMVHLLQDWYYSTTFEPHRITTLRTVDIQDRVSEFLNFIKG